MGNHKQVIMAREGGKASKAAKMVKKGVHLKSARKIRTTPIFYAPKTLRQSRNPKFPRIARDTTSSHRRKLDHYQIVKYPLATESAMKKIKKTTRWFLLLTHVQTNFRSAKLSKACMTS